MTLSLSFHGAAGTVTGSCFLLRAASGSVLIDCGLFQGSKTVRELNYKPFPFDPASIGAVLLTHAHIDHSGLLPKLAKAGFRGPIHATEGTAGLLTAMLPDSGYIQETEVDRLNRRNRQRGRPVVEPIYTQQDAVDCLAQVRPVPYGEWRQVLPGLRARFWNAGHILGSASIEVEVAGAGTETTTLLFSGDLGPGGKDFHPDAAAPPRPDWLVVEATYGDRSRRPADGDARRALLRREVLAAREAGGNLVIPVFAVERTQELLYDLDVLFDAGELPVTDVFLDSPLATTVTEVFRRYLPEVNEPGTPHPFSRPNLHLVRTVDESMRINRIRGGAIIMAASGMCDAGRIRHHLKNNLWRPESTVLLVGYQAPGTLGRLLLDGVERVRIHGEEVQVRARIRSLDVYSGHADRDALLEWVGARLPVGGGIFLVHGEDEARATLRTALAERGTDAGRIRLPVLDERFELGPMRMERAGQGEGPGTGLGAPRLPAEVLDRPDWHNRYAAVMLEIGRRLDAAPDAAAREALLDRLGRALAD